MTKQEVTDWALRSGWQMLGGWPSLTKPSSRKEAIVRLVLKATVVVLEVKRPAGKWEKFATSPYAKLIADPDSGVPHGLNFEAIPGFANLMQDNRDQMVFARPGLGSES